MRRLTKAVFPKLHRSEEHTSELQSQSNLVCRLLLEKQNVGHQTEPEARFDVEGGDFDEFGRFPAIRAGSTGPPQLGDDRGEPCDALRRQPRGCIEKGAVCRDPFEHFAEIVGDFEPKLDHRLAQFFFNEPATAELYTLSLRDALPI